MKLKNYKVFAILIAIVAYVGVFFFINAFCGNPISRRMVDYALDATVETVSHSHSYYVQDIKFNALRGCYEAELISTSSGFQHFMVYVDMFGKIIEDEAGILL